MSSISGPPETHRSVSICARMDSYILLIDNNYECQQREFLVQTKFLQEFLVQS